MLRDKILNNVVKKYDSDKYSSTTGVVTKYYKDENSVDVSIKSKGTKNLVLECIPLPIFARGVHSIPPKIGAVVLVTFTNNSVLQGKVVAIIDNGYKYSSRQTYSHIESGAYNCNIDFSKLKSGYNFKSLSEYTIDKKNDDSFKYFNYVKRNPIEEFVNSVSKLNQFQENDLGFIHPYNKSIVKIKDDGSIEIYTKNDLGIKIDPSNRMIELSSDNIHFKCNKWSISSDVIDFNCDEFNVKSRKITFDSDELDMQTSAKEFDSNDKIKEI